VIVSVGAAVSKMMVALMVELVVLRGIGERA